MPTEKETKRTKKVRNPQGVLVEDESPESMKKKPEGPTATDDATPKVKPKKGG